MNTVFIGINCLLPWEERTEIAKVLSRETERRKESLFEKANCATVSL